MILVSLPISICVLMLIMTPDFFKPMLESDTGRFALWLAAGMQVAGILAVRSIVNIRV
jgi:Flp pilus assembly protein TadB